MYCLQQWTIVKEIQPHITGHKKAESRGHNSSAEAEKLPVR